MTLRVPNATEVGNACKGGLFGSVNEGEGDGVWTGVALPAVAREGPWRGLVG